MLGSCQRKKSIKPHVRTACINCKKAHLACDAERPCKRCISVGKTDSCYDIQHKKRGRPKLREKYASSLHNGNNTALSSSPPSLYTSAVTKKQVSRHHTNSISHFQPMLPLNLPCSTSLPQSSSITNHNQLAHHHLISSPPSIDSLTPFLDMSPPPSSFIMTKPTTTKQEYDMTEALNEPIMTIFLTTEMCCARASDETMDFIGYHPQELAHRSLYDFISNPTDLHQIHQHLIQSHRQALHNANEGVSTSDSSPQIHNNSRSNNDYYHQMPPTTLLNIANGSKTFKMVLHFRTTDGKEQLALNARLYFGGGLGADLCQPSSLDHLYIVCLLTKSPSSSKSFSPGLALSGIPTSTTTNNNKNNNTTNTTNTVTPISPLSLTSPSSSTDTNITTAISVPSPISPPIMNSSPLSNESTAIQNVMTDFSSFSYLSSSLSSVSSSSTSSTSSHTPPLTSSSSSAPLSSIPCSVPPTCSSLMMTPPYSNNQTPSTLDNEESSLYSWLDFAFSSNGNPTK
ncbi:hypothetical protein BCR42DRAFT_489916 [Absidia repens]|uniref:Zn(2)-C6 fungal-type domain-containing protein n=1 Tax=Absidia repens TaxID=90262 RepID=A0A1X2ILE0_9FUNG|nr:hypothetical protein BCR42DRAFT_489916 [Absidia repens]